MENIIFKVDLQNLEALVHRYPEESRQARTSRITEALLLLERVIKQFTPEGAGPIHLRDTIFHKVEIGQVRIWGMIGTPAIYGEPVEYGTRPHFPPVKAIQHWVERKLRISGKEAHSVAFLIARAISRRGTKGAKMFGKGIQNNEANVIRILEMIPGDIVKRLNK